MAQDFKHLRFAIWCCSILCMLASTAADTPNEFDSWGSLCKKTIWMTGLTLRRGSKWLDEDGSTYYQHVEVALASAKAMAPSLLPVVVLLGTPNDTEAALAERLRLLGATVIFHELSFGSILRELADNGKVAHNGAFALGTYLRVDVANIFPKVLPLVSPATTDTEFMLWTDPDVIFYRDITSCSLPKPQLWSIAADVEHETLTSCGVIYFNMPAYTRAWGAPGGLLERGTRSRFGATYGELDQGFLLRSIGRYATLLPDLYNYKPYWGHPEKVFYRFQTTRFVIVHVQGPKLFRALCVFDRFEAAAAAAAAGSGPALRVTLERVYEALEACGARTARQWYWVAASLVYAWGHDRGRLYRDVAATFDGYYAAALRTVLERLDAGAAGSGSGAAPGGSGGAPGGGPSVVSRERVARELGIVEQRLLRHNVTAAGNGTATAT